MAKWDYTYKACKQKESFYGNWYMDPKCGHAKNEIVMLNYHQQLSSNIFNLGHTMENKQKLVQFATIFNQSQSMTIFNLCLNFFNCYIPQNSSLWG